MLSIKSNTEVSRELWIGEKKWLSNNCYCLFVTAFNATSSTQFMYNGNYGIVYTNKNHSLSKMVWQ